MINLNSINLNSVNPGGLELSGVKLGYPSVGAFAPASFDQAWTVTGKTNDDEDRATIKNLTGNGNALMLSNFAFSGNSGYGDYSFINIPASLTEGQPYGSLHFKTDGAYATSVKLNIVNIRIKFNLRNIPEGGAFIIRAISINASSTIKINTYTVDGSYEFVYDDPVNPVDIFLYNGPSPDGRSDFYVDIIPEYEGYLVTDGVDDKIISSSFDLGKDWTMIGDWKFIENKTINTGIVKASSLFLYNRTTGCVAYVNSGEIANSLNGIKSLNAVCSDGRVYDNNWNEILTIPEVRQSGSVLEVGERDGRFTQIAFKNLAFYNNKILSKEECIKAYNYLQTLKNK